MLLLVHLCDGWRLLDCIRDVSKLTRWPRGRDHPKFPALQTPPQTIISSVTTDLQHHNPAAIPSFMLDVQMTSSISYNLVAPRPKDQARYTIRELLILGLTLPVRFCPLNKFGPEALGLEIVSLERINKALWNFEREQWRMWQAAQFETGKNLQSAGKDRMRRAGTADSEPSPQQKVPSYGRRQGANWIGHGVGRVGS